MTSMSDAWYYALTSGFPNWGKQVEILPRFKEDKLGRKFNIGGEKSRRLAIVLSYWYTSIETLGFPRKLTERLQKCTMRFSHWKTKMNWRCECAAACPWCRALIRLDIYCKLVDRASRAQNLYVITQQAPIEDRRYISRPPYKSIASIRNVTYTDGYYNPEFTAAFFMTPSVGRTATGAEVCNKEKLSVMIDGVLGWDHGLSFHPEFRTYLADTKRLHMFALNFKSAKTAELKQAPSQLTAKPLQACNTLKVET